MTTPAAEGTAVTVVMAALDADFAGLRELVSIAENQTALNEVVVPGWRKIAERVESLLALKSLSR